MESFYAFIEGLVGAKAAAKVCAFLGAAFVMFGWLRGRGGRAFSRGLLALSQEEDLDAKFKALDERIDALERTVARLEGQLQWRARGRQ